MKGLKAQLPILKIQEKTVYCACILHSAPPKGTNHLSYPSSLTPASAPGLTLCKELPVHSCRQVNKGNSYLLLPPAAAATQ